ncbi:CCRG-2 family RiPP [Prochlorococcus marinus]|jgi:hypothetical protein|uniref:CCRG-2 family RiPP n=1 Tax=Prochlorococcus marinus TaxID=1219 RepID=UPI0022B456F4|nr:CCRG-2 family RiPP [Prochlorococcus marinus]
MNNTELTLDQLSAISGGNRIKFNPIRHRRLGIITLPEILKDQLKRRELKLEDFYVNVKK